MTITIGIKRAWAKFIQEVRTLPESKDFIGDIGKFKWWKHEDKVTNGKMCYKKATKTPLRK